MSKHPLEYILILTLFPQLISSAMTIIEGIGDEIIHIAIGIGVICLSILAWWSTHIRDVALYRTIVIVERNRRSNNNNSNSVLDQNQTEPLAGIPVSRNVHTTLSNEGEICLVIVFLKVTT